MATMHTVIRIDTHSYGWVVSQHRSLVAAQYHCSLCREPKQNRNLSDALTSIRYTTADLPRTPKGERVRYA